MSLQITVFLAVHEKLLRNTSDFISALLEEFIFLFWDLGSLSPFIDLRYNPEWQLICPRDMAKLVLALKSEYFFA